MGRNMQFMPSIGQRLILITLAAVFLRLGLWQLDRKAEKQVQFERFEDAPSMDLAMALESERVQLHELAVNEYDKLKELTDEFMETIEEVGPNPFKGF